MSTVLHEIMMTSGQPWASQRAQMALQITESVKQGLMSADEAKEILTDLINTDKLNEESADMQLRAALVFGVTQIISMY